METITSTVLFATAERIAKAYVAVGPDGYALPQTVSHTPDGASSKLYHTTAIKKREQESQGYRIQPFMMVEAND